MTQNEINTVIALIIIFAISFLAFLFNFKKQDKLNFAVSLIIPIYLIFSFWINAPCFISLPDSSIINNTIFELVYFLYNQFGFIYVIIANIIVNLLASTLCNKVVNQQKLLSKKNVCKEFNKFSVDAEELVVLGNDLDFLLDSNCTKQLNKIKKLKKNCTILCQEIQKPTNFNLDDNIQNNTPENIKYKKLVNLYDNLLCEGVNIRCYSRDNKENPLKSILGQIKITAETKQIKIVYKDENNFKNINIENRAIVELIKNDIVDFYNESRNPVIKCIAVDIGGVAFSGKIEDFYKNLSKQHEIKLRQKAQDKVNLDPRLSLGEIDICKFIENKLGIKINENLKSDILKLWNNTWKPDDKIFKILKNLAELGYEIVFISNLDRENGEYYKIKNYFSSIPNCKYFFSYEEKISKPDEKCFEKFEEKFSYLPCQILLIDDQKDNIKAAQKRKWKTIEFDNSTMTVEDLKNELKKISILKD